MFQVDEVLSPNSIDLVDTKVLLNKINVFKFQYYLNGKSLQLSSLFVIFLWRFSIKIMETFRAAWLCL